METLPGRQTDQPLGACLLFRPRVWARIENMETYEDENNTKLKMEGGKKNNKSIFFAVLMLTAMIRWQK